MKAEQPQSSVAEIANKVRLNSLKMIHKTNSSHIGSCLSMADILAVLYCKILKYDPSAPELIDRDKVIVSKGHSAAALYSVLALSGYFPVERLSEFALNGSPFSGHVTHCNIPGVELSTGSLGHGLPVGLGFALAQKSHGYDARTYVILSDGECDEGSNWEAILCAPQKGINNLTVIVDYNKIQSFGRVSEVLNLEPFTDKWSAFGWNTLEVDGHDYADLENAFIKAKQQKDKPTVLIAHTVKGKGVSFMEDRLEWHYRSPSDELLSEALNELSGETEL